MYKVFPSKLKPPLRKADYHQEQKAPTRLVRSPAQWEASNEKKNASICRKMEEKYVYSIGRQAVRRSTSINGNRKGNTDKLIEQEYGVSKVKQGLRGESREDCIELGCNSRESYKKLQKQATPTSRLRLVRIRSNDSLSRAVSNRAKQAQNQVKLRSLKDQNAYLKQLHTQSLTKIEELQKIQAHQKVQFEGEQKVYEKQIELLRSKVDKNKVDIGHLFSYQNFDPATLLVRPIIQVEENSSIMKSLYHNSNIKKSSIESEYGLFQRLNKKIPTETTALSSQNYKETAQLF